MVTVRLPQVCEGAMQPLSGSGDLAQLVRQSLLAARPELSQLGIRAQGGVVRLSGQVQSFYLRQLALMAARRVAGVTHVADDIEVDWF